MNDENSAYNVGCVGTPEGVVVLDADNPELISRIESETGHEMPAPLPCVLGARSCRTFTSARPR